MKKNNKNSKWTESEDNILFDLIQYPIFSTIDPKNSKEDRFSGVIFLRTSFSKYNKNPLEAPNSVDKDGKII